MMLRAPLNTWSVNETAHQKKRGAALRLRITQEEIQILIEVERVADVLCLNLRRRMELGAKVEPGKWRLNDDDGDSIESYEDGSVAGCSRCGLDIRETKRQGSRPNS